MWQFCLCLQSSARVFEFPEVASVKARFEMEASGIHTSGRRFVDCTIAYSTSPFDVQKKTRVPGWQWWVHRKMWDVDGSLTGKAFMVEISCGQLAEQSWDFIGSSLHQCRSRASRFEMIVTRGNSTDSWFFTLDDGTRWDLPRIRTWAFTVEL